MESAAEDKKSPHSVLTTSSPNPTPPWRSTNAYSPKIPSVSRGTQSTSWRQIETATTSSSPNTPQHFWSSPWNKTELNNSPSNFSSSPLSRDNTSGAGQHNPPPWKRLHMSGSPWTPNQGEVRPRLQLTIPDRSQSHDTQSTLQANKAKDSAQVMIGVGVDDFEPQQAAQQSLTNISTSKSQILSTRGQIQTMRRPHIFNANATEFLRREIPSPEELDGFVIGPRLSARTGDKSGDCGSSQAAYSISQRPVETSTQATEHPNHHKVGAEVPHAHSTNNPHEQDHTLVANDPGETGQASSTESVERPGQSPCPTGPRMMGGRVIHTNARGSPSRLYIPSQPRGAGSHTNSRTWINPRTKIQEKWLEVYRNLKEMSLIKEYRSAGSGAPPPVGGSFCVPTTLNEWTDHQMELANDRAREGRRKLARMEHQFLIPRHKDLPPAGPTAPITTLPFLGKIFGDGYSAVLCMATIWTTWKPWKQREVEASPMEERPRQEHSEEEERPEAMWPSEEEMREEGNERMTSGFRRFPALPRAPGNPTVNWKQKKALPQLPFDEIWRLPSADTYNAQREKIPADELKVMEESIGENLSTALDGEPYGGEE